MVSTISIPTKLNSQNTRIKDLKIEDLQTIMHIYGNHSYNFGKMIIIRENSIEKKENKLNNLTQQAKDNHIETHLHPDSSLNRDHDQDQDDEVYMLNMSGASLLKAMKMKGFWYFTQNLLKDWILKEEYSRHLLHYYDMFAELKSFADKVSMVYQNKFTVIKFTVINQQFNNCERGEFDPDDLYDWFTTIIQAASNFQNQQDNLILLLWEALLAFISYTKSQNENKEDEKKDKLLILDNAILLNVTFALLQGTSDWKPKFTSNISDTIATIFKLCSNINIRSPKDILPLWFSFIEMFLNNVDKYSIEMLFMLSINIDE